MFVINFFSGNTAYSKENLAFINLDEIIKKVKPDYIFVHGDTTTSAFSAISAFYHQITVCHVEAG